jgi:hypothetical protein
MWQKVVATKAPSVANPLPARGARRGISGCTGHERPRAKCDLQAEAHEVEED